MVSRKGDPEWPQRTPTAVGIIPFQLCWTTVNKDDLLNSAFLLLITYSTQPSGPEQCSAPSPDTILPTPTSRPTKHGSIPASSTRLLRSEASNARYATSATSPGWRDGAARHSTQTQVWKIRISGRSFLLSVDLMRPDTPCTAAWYRSCYWCRLWSRLCCWKWNHQFHFLIASSF